MYNKIIEILPLLNIDYVKGIITTPKGGHGTIDSTGYLVFKKNNTKFQLHQVLSVYHFGRDCIGMTVNHENGNKLDNSKDNLELMTLSDNVKHQWEIGLAVDPKEVIKKSDVAVQATNIITGEISCYRSIGVANRETGENKSSIWKCINGKRNRTKRYYWEKL